MVFKCSCLLGQLTIFRVTSQLISEKTIKLIDIHTFPIMNALGFYPNHMLSYCFPLKGLPHTLPGI